jgi:hypothetical protein
MNDEYMRTENETAVVAYLMTMSHYSHGQTAASSHIFVYSESPTALSEPFKTISCIIMKLKVVLGEGYRLEQCYLNFPQPNLTERYHTPYHTLELVVR